MTTFHDVVKAWQSADVDAIHPLRAEHVEDYWESGWFQAAQVAAHVRPGCDVVDFGCGDGRVAIPLAHMGFTVTAVDASPTMLERLSARAREQGNDFNPEDLTTVQSNGHDLVSQIDRTVDAVVCRAVLIHHGYMDGQTLISELSDLLKVGGVLIIDWPTGPEHERRDWIDVTVWSTARRDATANMCGLELVEEHPDGLTVWRRAN